MKALREEIILKLENILTVLNNNVDEKPYLVEIRDKLNLRLNELKNLKEVKTISRRYIEALLEVYHGITEFEKLLYMYLKGKSIYDEIYVAHIELNESITRLFNTVKSMIFREKILNTLPSVTVLTYCIFDTIYSRVLINKLPQVSIVMHLVAISLAIISVLLVNKRQTISYALLVATGLTGLFNKTYFYTIQEQPLGFDTFVYATIVFMSIIYLNTARIITSREYREKIENTIKNLVNLINSSRRETEIEQDKSETLWNKASELFKTLYGEKGEDLLKFKLETLVMNGLNRNDALKKIIDIHEKVLNKR
uniref:Uncharacterized protein n=1 Tax=Staphylothermus marinus TaxID=2280 RepID=A0A7C4NR42_STAMA